MILYFQQDKDKIYFFIEYAIEQHAVQGLKYLLNSIENIQELYSYININSYDLIDKAIASNNIVIKQKFTNPPSLIRLASVNYAKNTLAKISTEFNLAQLKNNLANYLPSDLISNINTIEDLFSMYC